MEFEYLKALHIIFVVTWFAGLFYIVRLFIYHVEALSKPEAEKNVLVSQFKIMQKRLWYGITWPSAIITLILAITLLMNWTYYLKMPWMHIKLSFVLLLYVYHFICQRMFSNLQNDRKTYTSKFLRLWNEVATILLFAIVFLVVLKTTTGWVWGVSAIVALAIVLVVAIKIYKRIREKKG
jgi:putative membrane protein